ncbi:UDP-N-acetylglucosamine--peptide N-acetylglucosaminyltransferase SPINDLY family protein [Reichenbachiella versicolor]|uniref:hypothetical protein n=1 Tax=Reichenbachiella versicolor TaxID=1821036 RepID=UPI0013A55953|nr:hypothetical protein [Reichenbachiella versicolor]
MNRFYVLALALLVSVSAWAQKGSTSKAQAYLDKNDLINAKAEIDLALENPKNAGKAKSWYIKGQIYKAIATSSDMAVSSLDPDAIQKAAEAYTKVSEMAKPNDLTAINASLNYDGLWGHFMDQAQQAYNKEDLETALGNFEKGLIVKPTDSVTMYYAGAVAQQMEDYTKAKKYYMLMKDNYMIPESAYQSLVYFERVEENNEEALVLVQEAKEKYPDNKTFINEELTILIVLNKLEEAETKLKMALANDPSVVQNHLNLAVLYDNLGSKFIEDGDKDKAATKFDLAIKSYNDAIALEPNNYVGNFNLGAIYVNKAKVYLDEARAMDLKTYQKQGPALEEKAKGDLKNALPYFQNVVTNKPNDVTAWSTLQSIYTSLKMYDEAEKAMAEVEKIEAKEGAQ